VYKFTTRK